MAYPTVISEEEMIACPNCGDALSADSPEFTGEGVMFRYISCDLCDFHAREEWVHDQTVDTES